MEKAWIEYLEKTWGLNSNFAAQIYRFLYWANYYGLRPQIVSGFRDPAKQKAMRARWDAGNRQGLRQRPAETSEHTRTSWGRPAASAIDIATTDDRMAARLAQSLRIGAGLAFKEPDPGHYFQVST